MNRLLSNKKSIFIFTLSIIPFLVWLLLSLTIMEDCINYWIVVFALLVGILLSISTAMDGFKANMISFTILVIMTIYFVYEGINNVYFGVFYPIFLIGIWGYYLLLNYFSKRGKKNEKN